jgi:DNA repair protein SbcC/Rad50
MRLKSLDLENWCQHSSLHIEFPDAAIVRISGPNNIGKSNFIKAIGRALAQGRSDYGDASDIRFGANHAEIKLQALTAEGVPFSITRLIKEKQSTVVMDYEGCAASLTSADEIRAQLSQWFGRQDTLLSLFIASQGSIASLLRTSGKQRLVEFIEICGFKSFLQKQAMLNKFIKAYPTIADPSLLLADTEQKLAAARQQTSERERAINVLPDCAAAKTEVERLQSEKLLRGQQKLDFDRKGKDLLTKQALVAKPLPDLGQIEASIAQQEASHGVSQICLQHQSFKQCQLAHSQTAARLAALHVDGTDYAAEIQSISSSLQKDIEAKNAIVQQEQAFHRKVAELNDLKVQLAACKKIVIALKYSARWHEHTVAEIQQGLGLLAQCNVSRNNVTDSENKIKELQAVPQPTAEMLAACQANEQKLQEIQEFQKHAKGARDTCPLCVQTWGQEAIAKRISELAAQIVEQSTHISKASAARRVYNAWVAAQKDFAPAKEKLEREKRELCAVEERLQQQLIEWGVPSAEAVLIPVIMAEYSKVHEALNPPLEKAQRLEAEVRQMEALSQEQQKEKANLVTRIETANKRTREVLQQQRTAQEASNQRAKLQQQVETMAQGLELLEQKLPPMPDSFDATKDYAVEVTQQEAKIRESRESFRTASSDWTNRCKQQKELEALSAEVAALDATLSTDPWSTEKEDKLAQATAMVAVHQQLNAELNFIRNQMRDLENQTAEHSRQKQLYDTQTRNLADLQAVSTFLSYDNGPQKFLRVFFQDTLNQTNMLISEMGLPVTLHMGDELEIIVRDKQQRDSSSLALGGGYANLIGIAFRIALQKMVLPRVNTIVLDEPSTHVDEQNMELLIPFFERLREKLNLFGIDQIVLIDHHPAWRNSSVEVIELGKGANASAGGAQTLIPLSVGQGADFCRTPESVLA